MTEQLPLPFELRTDHQLDSFVRGANAELCQRLLRLGDSNPSVRTEGDMIWVHGPEGFGKTHLLQGLVGELAARAVKVAYFPAKQLPIAHVADALEGSEQYRVLVLDDVDLWLGNDTSERELVRRYQERRHAGLHLLLSAKGAPTEFRMALADWQSRAQSAQVFRLEELLDHEKLAVLIARADRLGLELTEPIGDYLLRHGARGLPQMLEVLERADKIALAEQRRLTVPVLKKALQPDALLSNRPSNRTSTS